MSRDDDHRDCRGVMIRKMDPTLDPNAPVRMKLQPSEPNAVTRWCVSVGRDRSARVPEMFETAPSGRPTIEASLRSANKHRHGKSGEQPAALPGGQA
jgi:hypothetical protein